ncbi:MAG: GAF domain-containing protein [Anaerolineae bacterium]|nr:GAF domain-containing protein [Anaerolineae bacterium]
MKNDPPFLILIHNAALLLALVFLFDLLITNRGAKNFRLWRVTVGFLLGGIGIVVMMTPWVLTPGIVFDTRSVLLGISGLFFGFTPTLIAIAMTAAFRFYQGGIAAWTGSLVILVTGSIGILWRKLLHRPLETITAGQLYLFGLTIHIAMLICMFTLPFNTAQEVLKNITLPVLTIYPLATLAVGMLLINRFRREKLMEERARNEERLQSMVTVLEQPIQSAQEFLDFSLEEAIRLTNSTIGYIFLYSEEQQKFKVSSISKGARAQCDLPNDATSSKLTETGLLSEAVRQRKAIILNDYTAKNPLKKGLPAGHIQIQKYLAVPIFKGEQIVAVVGVANKTADYDQTDVLQLTLLMDGVLKAVEREQAEENRRQIEERYSAIANNLPGAVVHILDRELRYIFSAGEGLADLGLTHEMLAGKTIFETLGSEKGNQAAEHYQRVLNGEVAHFEGEYAGKHFIVHAAPLRDRQGNVNQILALSLDISARKQIEEERQKVQAELQNLLNKSEQGRRALVSVMEDQKIAEEKLRQINDELERRVQARTLQLSVANKELEAFAYSVSHDLRAPLRALDGFSGALLADYQNWLDDQGKHYLERIKEASQKMGRLIDDLLNLSRVTRREMRLETIDLSDLALELAHEFQIQAPERTIEFEIAPNLIARADAGLIKIALENLLGNAVKFTGKRPTARIQFGRMEQSGKAVFFVRDDGVGFDMAYANKLFTPFQRLHSEQEFPGTGIGLVTVQRIIHRHGGNLWPEAEVNKGATFYFTLEGAS